MSGLFLCTFFFVAFCVPATTSAENPDPFDLSSINQNPSYMVPGNYRPAATLNAVATAPVPRNPTNPDSPVSIAVGDGGTVLRSIDGGQSWVPIDRMTPLAEMPGTPLQHLRFGAKAPQRRFTSIPFWHFYDVQWLSPVDVVIVGGGFEPVTGISRGVCLYSDDAGETWSMGNAHELPRLQRIARVPNRPIGTLEATGDRSEASGVNRFFSYDAGRTWVEGTVADNSPQPSDSDTASLNRQETIRVGQYGLISVKRDGRWQTVRGRGQHAAAAFVGASARSVAWSLAGRESLHENRRVVMAMCNQPHLRLSADRTADAAKLIGVTICDHLSLQNNDAAIETAARWLRLHRPAVVVLDAAMEDAHHRTWMTAIERTRGSGGSRDVYPQRVLVTRCWDRANDRTAHEVNARFNWKRSSVLRSDALLTGPAVLAGDFACDVLMLAQPGCAVPMSVEVTTLDDLSGSIRRDVSLAAGLRLSDGQIRGHDERYLAANRRLQIASARVAQTANLNNQLAAAIQGSSSLDDNAITAMIQNVTALTAPADRTRLLWAQLTDVMTSPAKPNVSNRHGSDPLGRLESGGGLESQTGLESRPGLATVERVLLHEIRQNASPAAIRRWASWTLETISQSAERRAMPSRKVLYSKWNGGQMSNKRSPLTPLNEIAASDIPPLGSVQGSFASQGNALEKRTTRELASRSPAVSPFHVAPASYASPEWSGPPGSSFNSVAPSAILIPETNTTVWQASRGFNRMPNHPARFVPSPASKNSLETSAEILERMNWDFHPVIMAGRRISGSERASANFTSVLATRSTRQRPILDGKLDDNCWRESLLITSPPYRSTHSGEVTTRCTQDADFWFFAITGTVDSGLRIQLDCDGDYLTSMDFEVEADGDKRVTIDGLESASLTWYVAVSEAKTQKTHAEFAIRKADLPGSIQRVRVETIDSGQPSVWRAMPNPQEWFPAF